MAVHTNKAANLARLAALLDRKLRKPEQIMVGKRELIEPNGDKRYVRRNEKGEFKEVDDVGRSLTADRRQKAETVVPKGQGDRGDHKPE